MLSFQADKPSGARAETLQPPGPHLPASESSALCQRALQSGMTQKGAPVVGITGWNTEAPGIRFGTGLGMRQPPGHGGGRCYMVEEAAPHWSPG